MNSWCVVVTKTDQATEATLVFGPFETRNQAVLWRVQYTERKPEHKKYKKQICNLVQPLFD